ncbi:MAG: hypothetical protein RLZZ161_1098 [Bacteroidota bacterium]
MVDGYVAKSVEVHTNYGMRAQHTRRFNGILCIHGKVAANGQKSTFKLVSSGYELHIGMQGCITGVVKTIFRILNHKSCRISTGHTIGHGTAVHGIDHFNGSEFKLTATANIHGVNMGNAFGLKPCCEFPDSNTGAT